MTGIQPQLWVETAGQAVAFYRNAFGASVLHQVGEGDDIVAQLAVDTAVFWVSAAGPDLGRFSPWDVGGDTGRILLVVDDPETTQRRTVDAGAVEMSPVAEEHGWLVGRVVDPFGHEWEIGRPVGDWPPS